MLCDPRITQLATLLVTHSTRLEKDEHLLIEAFDVPEEIIIALIRACRDAGAHPHVAMRSNRILRALNEGAAVKNLETWSSCDRHRMEQMDAYIGLRGGNNAGEMAGIDPEQVRRIGQLYATPVHFDERVRRTKWCVLRWPSPGMAQQAGQGTEDYEDFYFKVCTLDYARMGEAVKPLQARMESADQVHIVGPGETDLSFSIKDISAIGCTGEANIPDGECYTAPVRDSVNGVIQYNTPSRYNGIDFENIRLDFEDGCITKATSARNDDALQSIFETDEGARYVGEFAIAFNPWILEPANDILFDEKIAGSLHFTPGQAYEEADNGNRSTVHWDLVLIQREEYGGGSIAFDDEIIRRDGLFLPVDLHGLNPEALME